MQTMDCTRRKKRRGVLKTEASVYCCFTFSCKENYVGVGTLLELITVLVRLIRTLPAGKVFVLMIYLSRPFE